MIKAMVLAAGVGSRLEPISSHLPKPLVPVLNRPVMEHILLLLQKHGVVDVISNTHHMAKHLRNYFGQNPLPNMNLQFFEESELSGDAGGVRAARNFLSDDTFVVIMGDLITNADISALIADHKRKKAIATIAVKQVKDVTRFGVMKRDSQGFIQAFQEKPKAHEAISNEISTGIYILEPAVFEHIPTTGVVGFGRQIFPSLVSKKLPVLGSELIGHWSDIGTLQDLFQTNLDALFGRIPIEAYPGKDHTAQTSDIAMKPAELGENSQIAKPVLIGKNVKIGKNTTIGSGCIIGDGSVISDNCQLSNCLLFSNSTVKTGTKVEDAILAFDHEIRMSSLAK